MIFAHYMNVATNVTGYEYFGPFKTEKECQDYCNSQNKKLKKNLGFEPKFRYYVQHMAKPVTEFD